MKESNVLNLEYHRNTRIAGNLISQVDEAIGELLAAEINAETREQLSQVLVHLHEAKVLLS